MKELRAPSRSWLFVLVPVLALLGLGNGTAEVITSSRAGLAPLIYHRPPLARRLPHLVELHGECWQDPYHWLRERENPGVKRYVRAENAYARFAMRDTEPLQKALFDKMVSHIQETDLSVPVRQGPYLYFYRTEKGQQYKVYCRRRVDPVLSSSPRAGRGDRRTGPSSSSHGREEGRRHPAEGKGLSPSPRGRGEGGGRRAAGEGSPSGVGPVLGEGSEEILLDGNLEAVGQEFFDLGSQEVSPDTNLYAYTVDTSGNEAFTLRIKDLRTGTLLADTVENTSGSVVWANDNRTLFYATRDQAQRPYRIYRHHLGQTASQDPLIYEEPDERFSLDLGKTRSEAYILISSEGNTTSEVRFLDADTPDGEFRVFAPRQPKVEYFLEHHGHSFFVTTNENAINFQVFEVPVDRIERSAWQVFIPHDPAVKIDSIEAFEHHLVLVERRNGLQTLRFATVDGRRFQDVAFDEAGYWCWLDDNPEFRTDVLRFHYASLSTPDSVFDLDLNTGERTLRKRKEVPGGYDPANYVTERLFAVASDGARIPINLVYRKGLRKDGQNPTYLTGYGAYGSCEDAYFSPARLALLDRGFVYADVQVRGGGEMGRQWYEDGKMLRKRNTFTDFIACAEHLIREGYTSPPRLAISGASAGGLLMGAVLTMRPDLFGAVVAEVPFVDVINTMCDTSIPLTAGEFEEWGNPMANPEEYRYMRSYSPYDNIRACAYPPVLMLAGWNDSRVQYWEPAKFTAALRMKKTDQNPLLMRTNMGAGHGGSSGRYDYLKDIAFEFAFVIKAIGQPY